MKTYYVYILASNIRSAIQREKRIKKWYGSWKIELIEKFNPDWKDLFYDLINPIENKQMDSRPALDAGRE